MHFKIIIFVYFNSQPHEEADVPDGLEEDSDKISTHSLTKRLTSEDYS